MESEENPNDGLIEAVALRQHITDIVGINHTGIRELLGEKFTDSEWATQGHPKVSTFVSLEIEIEMLRECPSSTFVHFSGLLVTHIHAMYLRALGVELGSPNHAAIMSLVSAALRGQLHDGPKSIQ